MKAMQNSLVHSEAAKNLWVSQRFNEIASKYNRTVRSIERREILNGLDLNIIMENDQRFTVRVYGENDMAERVFLKFEEYIKGEQNV